MSIAYPEGECFFDMQGLSTPGELEYQATNPDKFKNNILLEYIKNVPADWMPTGFSPEIPYKTHPRSSYAGPWRTNSRRYGTWKHLTMSYGNYNSILRRSQLDLCWTPKVFQDCIEGGASKEAWFVNLPQPTIAEKWIWIDLVTPIRAIYIPVCQTGGEGRDDLSTWVQVSFARTGDITVTDASTTEKIQWKTDVTMGLGGVHRGTAVGYDRCYECIQHQDYSLGIDIYALTALLCLPRQMRKYNSYDLAIRVVKSSLIDTAHIPLTWPDVNSYFDMTHILQANMGLELQWKPADQHNNFLLNLFKRMIDIGLSIVPGVGPLLVFGFDMVWDGILDPEAFLLDMISNGIGAGIPMNPTSTQKEAYYLSIEEVRKNIAPRWLNGSMPATKIPDADTLRLEYPDFYVQTQAHELKTGAEAGKVGKHIEHGTHKHQAK